MRISAEDLFSPHLVLDQTLERRTLWLAEVKALGVKAADQVAVVKVAAAAVERDRLDGRARPGILQAVADRTGDLRSKLSRLFLVVHEFEGN